MERTVRAVAGVGALTIVLATLGGCADDEAAPLRPLVAEIGAAVEAVETELGRAQQYFEINATPQFVNLFVAVDDATAVVAYLYVDGELGPPRPPEGADGATFAATALTFDPDLVLGGIDDDLPDSDVVVFSVVGGPDGAVRYGAVVESGEGGQLDVTLDAAGTVRAVDPL